MAEKKLTGYPLIDKPWMKYYSEETISTPLPEMTMYQYIWDNNKDHLSDVALCYYGTKITYEKLFENIKKAASAFWAMGIRAGDIVTIMSMHTPETIYAIYGLNYIGAISNMVYITLAGKEIITRVNNTNSKALLVLDILLDRIHEIEEEISTPVLVLNVSDSMPWYLKTFYKLKHRRKGATFRLFSEVLFENNNVPPLAINHSAPAIIVYTSGTTGEPKGVMLSNDGVNAHSFQLMNANFNFERKKHFLNIQPPFIGFGITHLHLGLNTGVTMILWIEINSEAIANAFFRNKPEYFVTGPVFMDAIINHKPVNLKNLELFVGGGGSLSEEKEKSVNELFRKCHSNVVYANGYGMTEAGSTLCSCTSDINKGRSVGIPLPLTNVRIINPETKEDLLCGETGELCFATPSLMTGYYNNPTETETIIFSDNGCSWLKTGDLGTVDEDGFVYLTGRIKRIFPVSDKNGVVFRLFPQHIEEYIESLNIVEKCAVLVRENSEHIYVPEIMVLPKDNNYSKEQVVDMIFNACKEGLSEYEWPLHIYVIEKMPMTASGKIDYQILDKIAVEQNEL